MSASHGAVSFPPMTINEFDGVIYVAAPEIMAKEPSVDSLMVGTYSGGVLIFKKEQKLEALKSTVSAVARERAINRIPLVKENCRRSINKIIMKWCKRYGFESKAVLVRFIDEKEF